MTTPTAELMTLCRRCGLCCDGSLFGRVPLEAAEAAPARRHGLAVLPDGRAFEQPCAALVRPVEGGRAPEGALNDVESGERACAAYAERPGACRRFVCSLFVRHRDEGGPLEPRLAAVARAKVLLRAVARDPSSPDRAELERRMADDFSRAGGG